MALFESSVFSKPGETIVKPIALPSSALRVSKKFMVAALLAWSDDNNTF